MKEKFKQGDSIIITNNGKFVSSGIVYCKDTHGETMMSGFYKYAVISDKDGLMYHYESDLHHSVEYFRNMRIDSILL